MNHHPLERKNGGSSAKMVTLVVKLVLIGSFTWFYFKFGLMNQRKQEGRICWSRVWRSLTEWINEHPNINWGHLACSHLFQTRKAGPFAKKHVMVRDWYHLPSFIHRNKPASWNGRPKRVDFTRIWLANLELSTSQMMGIVLSYERT